MLLQGFLNSTVFKSCILCQALGCLLFFFIIVDFLKIFLLLLFFKGSGGCANAIFTQHSVLTEPNMCFAKHQTLQVAMQYRS